MGARFLSSITTDPDSLPHAEQLQALTEVIDTLGRATDSAAGLQSIYSAALSGLQRAFGIDRASILLFDPDGVMRFKAWIGISDDYRRAVEGHTPWPLGTLNPSPVIVFDVLSDATLTKLQPVLVKESIRALAFIPLLYQDRLLGKFMLYSREPSQFTNEVAFGLTLGRLIAFAIVRKQAEDKSLENERRLRAILENEPECVKVVDREGTLLEMNPAGLAMIEADDASSAIGQSIYSVIARPHRAAFQDLTERVCAGESGTLEFELIGHRGSRKWMETHAVPFFDTERGHLVLLAVTRDITSKKQAELNLIRAHEQVRFLADASRVLVSSLDYESTLRSITQLIVSRLADWCMLGVVEEGGSIRLLSVAADQAQAALARELEHCRPDLAAPEGMPKTIRTGKALLYSEIKDEQLTPAPGHWSVVGTRDPKHLRTIRELGLTSYMAVPLIVRDQPIGAFMIASSKTDHHYDTSDLALAEELGRRASVAIENARLYKESLRSIQLREDFIAIASHELRTPLTPLKMQLFILKRHFQSIASQLPNGDALMDVLQKSDKQLDRMTRLVEDLLDISRITRGSLTLTREECKLEEIVRDVENRYRTELASAKCNVKLGVVAPVKGMWDRLRIEQVIVNLLRNAMKYGVGKPIEMTVTREGEFAKLSVRDFGIGIAKEDQEKIFQRFERAVPITAYGGLGLGLFITRQIVAAHGGTIEVDSELGAGSTFSVKLPMNPT